jgi:TRAP-type C4-dicarboxylate transport system permease small subunit
MNIDTPLDKKSLFDRILDLISSVNTVITGVALVVLTIIFGWLVFGRYVLNATPTWVEQVSLLLIVYIGFLGASVGVHKNTHLGVSVFREMSPQPLRRIFELISHLLMAGFALVMAVYGYKLTFFKWSTEIPLFNISEGFRAIPIMLSGVFILLFTIGHLIHFFTDTHEIESIEEKFK